MQIKHFVNGEWVEVRQNKLAEAFDHAAAHGSAFESNLYKIATNNQGHVTQATSVTKTDLTNYGLLDTNAVAPVYSDNTTYSTGEFCIYQGKLYKALQDVDHEEFNPSKWEESNLLTATIGGGTVVTGEADWNAQQGDLGYIKNKPDIPEGLPSVSAEDDGKTLVVDDGEWTIGSGSELPIASASNEGQALVSTKKYVKGAVIVPEQTVTLDSELIGQLSNTNNNLFTVGTNCIAVIGGTEWQGVVYEHSQTENATLSFDNGSIEFWIELDNSFNYYNENLQEGDEITVALYVAEPAYSWEPDPYAGYDVIIKTSVSNLISNITADELELVKGSYEAASKLALDGKPIKCIVYYCYIYDDGATYWEYPINRVYCDPGYNNSLVIHILQDDPQVDVKDANGNTMRIFGASAHYGLITLTESGLSYNFY